MNAVYGEKSDIGAWMDLVRLVRDEFPGLETEEAIQDHEKTVLKFMDKMQAICVKDGDKIAGVLLFSRNRNMICFLAVAPDQRRNHIASALMEKALDELDRYRGITVSTFREDDPKGTAPRALYKKFGFVEEELTIEFGYPNQVFVLPRIFRPMRRIKQMISREECVVVLKEQPRGVLSMIGDGGYPYGIPLDHFYSEEDDKLYFHCAKEGHKLDAISDCDKVSYCVMDQGYRKEGEWALNIRSVVIFGRMKLVSDPEKTKWICTNLVRKFTDDEEYLQHELTYALPRVQCMELIIDHMTGKLVNES